MASNPLLGSRISLISKKDIRYEGTLYSINEADATVALQNVRAYGTEGRETNSETFVPPQDQVHPYLLFRGCDIKDLHVHENSMEAPTDPAILSADQPKEEAKEGGVETPEREVQQPPSSHGDEDEDAATRLEGQGQAQENRNGNTQTPPESSLSSSSKNDNVHADHENATADDAKGQQPQTHTSKPKQASNNRRKKSGARSNRMVGNGASLLNRKARGVVDGADGPTKNMEHDFDFETNLAGFDKTNEESDYEEESDDGAAYSKDDFFDSISNDVMDRQSGANNRLRGAQERSLNTETFGATSLGNNRRYRRRGGGRGRGRGREWGRGGRGRGGRERGGGRRQYGDGGLSQVQTSQVQTNNRWRNDN